MNSKPIIPKEIVLAYLIASFRLHYYQNTSEYNQEISHSYKQYIYDSDGRNRQLSLHVFVVVVVFLFNVPQTAKVIRRRGHSLKSHPTDW